MVETDDIKQLRLAIVGGSCIGKTCIVKRFSENSFHGNQYAPTPGVEFVSRRLTIKPIGTVTLLILDIGGAALTSKMLDVYLHAIDIYLLTYDMTNATSLQDVRKWLDLLVKKGIDKSEASIALVGSKGDLEHLRTVRLDSHTRLAQEYNIPLSFLVSAKSGESVLTCFSKCAMYHLNPETKQNLHDAKQRALAMAIQQQQQAVSATKRMPPTMSTPGVQSLQSPTLAQPLPTRPDPNSIACSVQ